MTTEIKRRLVPSSKLTLAGMHPILEQIFKARGISDAEELDHRLSALFPLNGLKGLDQALPIFAKAIRDQETILIVGDYDADGATSCALMVDALTQFGSRSVRYLVPNRFEFGYGLTPELVEAALALKPSVIVTVDNGITSVEGVATAKLKGIQVIITDHHLPGEVLPAADAIINPNQPGDTFPCKSLAGVGVSFYVMLALRKFLRESGCFDSTRPEPNIADLLDLVALGTVADVVALDHNNRILVQQGLLRIQRGQCRPGIKALAAVAKRSLDQIQTSDLAFALAPRLNAAGRMDDISVGIACLLCTDFQEAYRLAEALDAFNKQRREVESDMRLQAEKLLRALPSNESSSVPDALCLYHPDFHQGVIGILAGRLKERYYRPAVVFAAVSPTEWKGSVRSISEVHIRDVLANIARQSPDLILKFGGHALAGGLSLRPEKFSEFSQQFSAEVRRCLGEKETPGILWSDGALPLEECDWRFVDMLKRAAPWGQAFPEPLFDDEFELVDQRLVGGRHLKMSLRLKASTRLFDAIFFQVDLDRWPNERATHIHAAYRVDINEYNGLKRVQLIVLHADVLSARG